MHLLSLPHLAITAVMAVSPLTDAVKTSPNMITVHSLGQITERAFNEPCETLFLFDIDDTLFDHPYMLGSKAWRAYIAEATKQIDPKTNWHDIFSYHLARDYPVQTVEKQTSEFVKKLQEKGYVVCGFTSRERGLWYDMPQKGVDTLTANQLRTVGIDFNNQSLEQVYPCLAQDSEYAHGIFFANIEPKGNFLSHLLKDNTYPRKIVFVDDKEKQAASVAKKLSELGIPHESYLYTATQEKADSFNPLIANIQLYTFYKFGKVISDLEAAQIALEQPDRSIEDYLKEAIHLAKKQLEECEEKK